MLSLVCPGNAITRRSAVPTAMRAPSPTGWMSWSWNPRVIAPSDTCAVAPVAARRSRRPDRWSAWTWVSKMRVIVRSCSRAKRRYGSTSGAGSTTSAWPSDATRYDRHPRASRRNCSTRTPEMFRTVSWRRSRDQPIMPPVTLVASMPWSTRARAACCEDTPRAQMTRIGSSAARSAAAAAGSSTTCCQWRRSSGTDSVSRGHAAKSSALRTSSTMMAAPVRISRSKSTGSR